MLMRSYSFPIVTLALMACLILAVVPERGSAAAGGTTPQLNAFLFKTMPQDYGALEKLFASLKRRGANAVIIPASAKGPLAFADFLPNVVFLAHQSMLRVYVIIPVRDRPAVLKKFPAWEDLQYDLTSGTRQPTGKLDLFNPDATRYLVRAFKEVATYSVDGILLGEDFYFSDIDCMTTVVLEKYKDKYNKAFVPGKAIAKVGMDKHGPVSLAYGEGFTEWAALKRDRLIEVLQEIMTAARKVNRNITFGVPLHGPGLASPRAALSKYAYDMKSFGAVNVDYYWIAIPHREIRRRDRLSFKKTMEVFAQTSQAAVSAVQDPHKTVIVLQATYLSGRTLPYSEIEEVAALAKQEKEVGIALMLRSDRLLPKALTKKLFRNKKTTDQ